MSLEPKVGWLLGYSYLWADDHRRGAEEGVKNRPCALVAAMRRDGERIVAVVRLASRFSRSSAHSDRGSC